jgi:hypothetical protein
VFFFVFDFFDLMFLTVPLSAVTGGDSNLGVLVCRTVDQTLPTKLESPIRMYSERLMYLKGPSEAFDLIVLTRI